MRYTNIINKIKANKRILYLSFCTILILFSLVLNITFSLMTKDNNTSGANIVIGDLKYNMVINDTTLSSSVGTKLPSNTIIGDRIILLKAGLTEQFNVVLTSKNNINTKYEITYKVCTDVNCTNFIDTPVDINISYYYETPYINGTLEANKNVLVSLISDNQSENNYYVQVNLNVGYSHNELALTNQIGSEFNPSSLEGNLSIVAYVNGIEVETFPTEPNYETGITCLYKSGATAGARGVFRYSAEKGWEVDIFGLNKNLTTCKVDFTEVLKVTYEVLSTRYDCANLETANKPTDTLISYTGNCSVISDTENNDGSHTWRMKLLTSGSLTVNGFMYIDVFLVGGGGGGGEKGYCAGGGGGYTKTVKNIKISNETSYDIVIGAGGAYNGEGESTSAFDSSVKGGLPSRYYGILAGDGGSGGSGLLDGAKQDGGSYGNNGTGSPFGTGQGTTTCEFGEGTLSGCTRGDEYAYAGGGGSCQWGNGGTGGGGYGGNSYYGGGTGHANTGGGGGGGNDQPGGSGGSGVVVIRDVRT